MVTSIVSPTSAQRLTPYITADAFKTHARAGVQVENLVPKGSPADQEAALTQYIEAASAWIDERAEMTFAATVDTVVQQVNVDNQGFVEIHPRYIPVIGLTAFSVGALPSQLQALDSLAGAVVTTDAIHVPVYPLAMLSSSQGPIQFGGINSPWDQAWCQYTYVNGYPVTTLTADVAQGATSVPVLDTTGIVAGKTWLTIYSGKTRYRFLAGTVSTADAGGLGTGPGTVGCVAVPFAIDNPDIATQVSALPSNLIMATVLVTRGLIKQKGSGAVAASSMSNRMPRQGRQNAGDDFAEAWEIIERAMQVAVTT